MHCGYSLFPAQTLPQLPNRPNLRNSTSLPLCHFLHYIPLPTSLSISPCSPESSPCDPPVSGPFHHPALVSTSRHCHQASLLELSEEGMFGTLFVIFWPNPFFANPSPDPLNFSFSRAVPALPRGFRFLLARVLTTSAFSGSWLDLSPPARRCTITS